MKTMRLATMGAAFLAGMGCSVLPRADGKKVADASPIRTEMISPESIAFTNVTITAAEDGLRISGKIQPHNGYDIPHHAHVEITALDSNRTALAHDHIRCDWHWSAGRVRPQRNAIVLRHQMKVDPSRVVSVKIQYCSDNDLFAGQHPSSEASPD